MQLNAFFWSEDNAMHHRLIDWQRAQVLTGPSQLHIDVANSCNQKCVTCWNYSLGLKTPKSITWKRTLISADLFISIVNDAAALGTDRVIISGSGDPLSHPEILKLAGHVIDQGLEVTVMTNGTYRRFLDILKMGPNTIVLSMHAASNLTYKKYHPGCKEDTFHTLVEVVRDKHPYTQLVLVNAINAINYLELTDMVRLAAVLGARIQFKVADIPDGCETYTLSKEARELLLKELIPEANMSAHKLGVSHNLNVFEMALDDAALKPSFHECFAGHLYSRVYVDGSVFYCCAHIPVGNVNSMPFRDIWFSAEYDEVRSRLRARDFYPACGSCGKADMNLKATALLNAETTLSGKPRSV